MGQDCLHCGGVSRGVEVHYRLLPVAGSSLSYLCLFAVEAERELQLGACVWGGCCDKWLPGRQRSRRHLPRPIWPRGLLGGPDCGLHARGRVCHVTWQGACNMRVWCSQWHPIRDESLVVLELISTARASTLPPHCVCLHLAEFCALLLGPTSWAGDLHWLSSIFSEHIHHLCGRPTHQIGKAVDYIPHQRTPHVRRRGLQ